MKSVRLLVIVLLAALASVVLAAPSGTGWANSVHSSAHAPSLAPNNSPAFAPFSPSEQAFFNSLAARRNQSAHGPRGVFANSSLNQSSFRASLLARRNLSKTDLASLLGQFRQAVHDGVFSTASQLFSEYGFGGPAFARFNEASFARYAQFKNPALATTALGTQNASLRSLLGSKPRHPTHTPAVAPKPPKPHAPRAHSAANSSSITG